MKLINQKLFKLAKSAYQLNEMNSFIRVLNFMSPSSSPIFILNTGGFFFKEYCNVSWCAFQFCHIIPVLRMLITDQCSYAKQLSPQRVQVYFEPFRNRNTGYCDWTPMKVVPQTVQGTRKKHRAFTTLVETADRWGKTLLYVSDVM